MGIATHLGPWMLGTVKDTTGTTAGTINNLGATSVAQVRAIAYAETTAQTRAFVLPAGAIIDTISALVTTAYTTTAATLQIFVNGNAISAATTLTAAGSTGVTNIPLGTSNPALVANVGSTDAVVSFTQVNGGGGTGAITLMIHYVVRNPNGSYAQIP